MNRTQENITKYKGMLPGLKEKLVAAVLVVTMTAAMLVTSTFAWLTLSYNPQVQNVHTAVATNGNLEIALATGDITLATAPGASKEGDSKLPIVDRNITWGNLINLNDSSYGLKHLVLRPSLLNSANLIERPLYGPVYDKDGRVVDMNTNFGYSEYDTFNKRFKATNKLGVRAITSMKYGESGAQNLYNMQLNQVADANIVTQSEYLAIAQADENKKYMDALASMMTGYMVENFLVNSSAASMIGDATLLRTDVAAFAEMYEKLIEAFESHAEDVASLLNFEAKMLGKDDLKITAEEILNLEYNKTNKTAYKKLVEMGFETYADSNKTVGVIKSMDSFLYDYYLLKADLIRLNKLYNDMGGNITWKNCPLADNGKRMIDDIIGNLTNVGECTITGGDYKDLKIKSVGARVALNLKGKTCETKITNGVLFNFDNYTGGRIRNHPDRVLSLTVQAMGTQTIYSHVSTSATLNHFESERAYVAKIIEEKHGAPELIANDSYGFAVDFWVRTNASGSFLTLEGNVLTKTEQVDVKGKNADGEEVQLYTISVAHKSSESTGSILDEMITVSYDVYESTHTVIVEEDGQPKEVEEECLRFAENHEVVTEESLGGQAIPDHLKKVEEITTVIGYEGENRVWNGEEHSLLTVSSTTQGSGSCYTFYAETPTDQQRSLKLLESMKIAFVDDQGTLLTTAYMDTKQHYASSGKVIVPIVLSNESIAIGQDDNGDLRFAITALDQNVPKRISAIVYLDGANLTNDDVLAAADIQGQMNIQFGSSVALVPLNNETLYSSEFYAEVEQITPDEFDFDTLPTGAKMESNVKVRISGTQPQQVKANFIRRINATQGSPEEEFTLTDADGDGVWEGSYGFKYPGTYILRSIVVDGVERDLKIPEGQDFPKVLVKGFSITSVSYEMSEFIMTDVDHYSGNVSLQFMSDNPDKMPKTVVGKFVRDDGAEVNVNFNYNATTTAWQGVANFTSSGEYTMQYVLLDGQYVELPEAMQKTVDLTLGMRVNVETSSPTTIFYGEPGAPTKLGMQVRILDNNNDIIKSLAGATLVYKMTESEALEAVLKYNSGREFYEGEFNVAPGTWKFDHLSIRMGSSSTNELRKVNTDSPVFTVVPPTPPEFVGTYATNVQYVSNDNDKAVFEATLKESGSAIVYAKLEDDSGNVAYSLGELASSENDTFKYNFTIEESGLWTVKSVSVFGAFDADRNYHPVQPEMNDDNYIKGIVFDSTNSDFAEKEIAALYQKDITVSYSYADNLNMANNTILVGKNKDGTVTRTFMQATTLPEEAIKVTITDKGNLISKGYFNISNVSLSYEYGSLTDDSGNSYGNYTTTYYDNNLKNTLAGTISFAAKNATLFALTNANNPLTLTHSAQYTPEQLKYTVTSDYLTNLNNQITIENASAYKLALYSKSPTVTITDITMDDFAQPYSVDNSPTGITDILGSSTGEREEGCNKIKQYEPTAPEAHIHSNENTKFISKISNSGLNADLYFKCNHPGYETPYIVEEDDGGTWSGTTYTGLRLHSYGYNDGKDVPAASLTLSGLGGASKATLTFAKEGGGDVHLYTRYTEDSGGKTAWTNSNDRVSTYEWTTDNSICKRYVGELDNGAGEYGNDKKTAAGTLKGSALELTYDGQTYSFTIPEITINNPF